MMCNKLMDASARMAQMVLLPALLLLVLQIPIPCVLGTLEADIQCLMQFKASVNDPLGYLDSWTLSDPTFDYCDILGLSCLHGELVSIVVANSSLSGSFPEVQMCNSLNKLDLSNNKFSGPIDPALCAEVPQLTIINLANNQFNGSIPENLATCYFVNDLYLQNNDLCGPVPVDINNKTLPRLKEFGTSGNDLGTNCVSDSGPSMMIWKRKRNVSLIVGAVTGALGVVILAALGVLLYWCFFSKRLGDQSTRFRDDDWIKHIRAPNYIIVSMFEKPLVKLSLSDLMAATNGFSQANVISSGKSGCVYKGTTKDGGVLAIKRLAVTDRTAKEFKAEMETLGKLRHRNLVPLLGYCIAGRERILVYKHMPCGNLEDLLNGISAKGSAEKAPVLDSEADVEKGVQSGAEMMEKASLDWQSRLKLAIGIARGLAWLHHSCNPRVLHRNICPTNILLDNELEPKIANFGLARLMNPVDTHVSTFVNGDFGHAGYVAPEYARTLVATVKGDVFSFGVVLLQLISGQKATQVTAQRFKGNLASWVWSLYNSGRVEDSIDKSLVDGIRDDELMQFLGLAVSCVHPVPKERPSVYEVFHMLRAIGEKYHLTDENDDIPVAPSTTELNLN